MSASYWFSKSVREASTRQGNDWQRNTSGLIETSMLVHSRKGTGGGGLSLGFAMYKCLQGKRTNLPSPLDAMLSAAALSLSRCAALSCCAVHCLSAAAASLPRTTNSLVFSVILTSASVLLSSYISTLHAGMACNSGLVLDQMQAQRCNATCGHHSATQQSS